MLGKKLVTGQSGRNRRGFLNGVAVAAGLIFADPALAIEAFER